MSVAVIDFSKAPAAASPSPLNPLSRSLRTYILDELRRALEDPTVASVALTGGPKNFSAGADLTELQQFEAASTTGEGISSSPLDASLAGGGPTLLDVVAAIEVSPKPVVAAIAGSCLGGGLEVALACHYRVCLASTTKLGQLGLPEVHVGVIPGAGGTQRLPRLIGLQPALEMILTGGPVSAKNALKLGLVDALVDKPQDLLKTAKKWARWAEVMPLDDRRLSHRKVAVASPAEAHVVLHVAGLQLPKPEAGGEGMRAALEAVRASCFALPPSFAQGMREEGRLFLRVLQSGQGRARRHAFFAVRKAQKPVQQPQLLAANLKSHPLLTSSGTSPTEVAVIGAGLMGSGIAFVLLRAGFTVWLVDVSQPALQKGLAFLSKTVETHAKRGKLSPKLAQQILTKQLRSTSNLEDLSDCLLVVEAVIENLKVKQSIFQTLATVTPPSALLVSNTSTLDIDQLASAVNDPSRVAGWHFFSPAHVMQLVEVVVGAATSQETVAILQALTKRIRKIGVVVGNCDGFCGNRMLKPYSFETFALLTETGASVEQVDCAFLEFGIALGPFQMSDLAGNDIGYNIRRERGWVRENPGDPVPPKRPARYNELGDVMVAQYGRNGQKAGKGWYDYDPAVGKGRKGLPSEEMANLVQSYATERQSSLVLSNREMVERVLFPLVNEGFKVLEEGIARCPSDVDVVYLYGYGFPAWRGGPMYWADNDVGLPTLLAKLRDFRRQFPDTEHFVPSRLLEECVSLGVTVEEYYRRGMHKRKSSRSRL